MKKNEIREILHELDLIRRKILKPDFLKLGLAVGEGQPRILKSLFEKGEMTQKELADICMLDATTMSRTIDKMENSGLLKRKNNPSCRRSYLISLTEKGKDSGEKVSEIFKNIDEKIWKNIDEKEMENLYTTLIKIKRNLNE